MQTASQPNCASKYSESESSDVKPIADSFSKAKQNPYNQRR